MVSTKPHSVRIGLINPKSPDNVNSVMRAAANYAVDAVFYSGSRYQRALEFSSKIPNISRSLCRDIPKSPVDDMTDQLSENMQMVCVEFAEDAISLPEYQPPEKALYVFGPEDGSISQDIIDHADAVIYIPTHGCMNLAATVNVLLYDRLAKAQRSLAGNGLIRESRDVNNNLKVR